MVAKGLPSEQIVAGWILIASFLVFCVGGMLYTGRAIWNWSAGQTRTYLVLERCFVVSALLVAVLGYNLLEKMLEGSGDRILAPSGMVLLLIGAGVVIVGESFFISRKDWIYAAIVAFVILTFLAEALFGAALLRTGFLPIWIGWATILWSLGWLVVLPIARPDNMYYPWLFYIAPLMIGVGLLVRR